MFHTHLATPTNYPFHFPARNKILSHLPTRFKPTAILGQATTGGKSNVKA